jgi:hypothetical protein
VSFDLHGIKDFESDPHLQDLQRIFARARQAEATAWTISVLEGWPSDSGGGDHRAMPVRQMHSRMRPVTEPVTYVAHQLHLFWLQVPEDMVGGNLLVFKGDRGDPAYDPSVLASPDLVLEAEENTDVQMRGDVYVQMEPFRSRAAGHLRVVMLEQYILPPDLLKHNVKPFFVHQQTVAEEDEARQRAQEGKKSAAELEKVIDKETVEKETVKSHR